MPSDGFHQKRSTDRISKAETGKIKQLPLNAFHQKYEKNDHVTPGRCQPYEAHCVSLTSAQSDFPSEEELERIISVILTREAPAAPHKHYISLILHYIAFNAHKLESVLDNA